MSSRSDMIRTLALTSNMSRAEIARECKCSAAYVTIVLGARQQQVRRSEADRHAIFERSPSVRRFSWEFEA